MSDTLLHTTDGPTDLTWSNAPRATDEQFIAADADEYLTTFDPQDTASDAAVDVEEVEGLPMALVRQYAEIAVRHSCVREADPGVYVATVVGLDGAWGDGDTPDEAVAELHEAIIGWVAVKRRLGATDIPPMEGIDLSLRA